MATCFQPIYGKRLRITQLDECGNLPAASTEDAIVVTDGFVSIALSSEVESATEILSKKADGSLCANERTNPSFKYFTVELNFCGVDVGALSLTTNAEIYETAAAEPGGIVVPEGTISKRFALEIWTGLTGGCEEGAQSNSGYLLLPFVNAGVLGNLEINGENVVNFTLTNSSTRGGNTWGVGPYGILGTEAAPTALPTALDPLDHLLLTTSTVAPPVSQCGLQPMPTSL